MTWVGWLGAAFIVFGSIVAGRSIFSTSFNGVDGLLYGTSVFAAGVTMLVCDLIR